jgi:hypothetical protein
VRQAIERRLTSIGDDFPTVASLLEAVFQIEEEQASPPAATTSLPAAAGQQQTPNESSDAPVKTNSSKKKRKKKKAAAAGAAAAENGGNLTASDSLAGGDEEDEESAEKLEEENRQLKESRNCKVCMDNDVNTVFLPCGHLVCCDSCSRSVTHCPICRTFIRGTVKTFLS